MTAGCLEKKIMPDAAHFPMCSCREMGRERKCGDLRESAFLGG